MFESSGPEYGRCSLDSNSSLDEDKNEFVVAPNRRSRRRLWEILLHLALISIYTFASIIFIWRNGEASPLVYCKTRGNALE